MPRNDIEYGALEGGAVDSAVELVEDLGVGARLVRLKKGNFKVPRIGKPTAAEGTELRKLEVADEDLNDVSSNRPVHHCNVESNSTGNDGNLVGTDSHRAHLGGYVNGAMLSNCIKQ